MTLQKILWFGPPMEATVALNAENWHNYYIEHLPVHFSLSYLDLLGQFAVAVVRHKTRDEGTFKLLRNLRRLRPEVPLILLAENPTKSEIIEAFRTGATDCVEEPIELDGFFYQVERLIQEKVTNKVNNIYKVLNEIGKKIVAALYQTQNYHFVSPVFFPKLQEEQKATQVIRVQFFGKFAISVNGKEQPCRLTRREKSLLAYLLLHHHKPISRDRLIDKFWNDTPSDSGRNSLHVAISGIRRYLESIDCSCYYISFQNNMYSFNPELEVESDVAFFQKYFQEAWHLENQEQIEEALYAYHRAFSFYRDSFLAELESEEWIADERRRLEEKFMVVLKTLGEYFFEYQQFEFAIQMFEKILEIDTCYEQAYQGLMRSYYAKTMTGQAIRQYQLCVAALSKELDAKPSNETIKLYKFICNQS